MNPRLQYTVKSEIKAAPQKCVIPKEKVMLCLFSFGITIFWGAAFISDFTVIQYSLAHFTADEMLSLREFYPQEKGPMNNN